MDVIFIILLIVGPIVIFALIFGRGKNAEPTPSNSSTYNSPSVPQQANEAFTKLFDTGMKNVLALTQQNPEVARELKNNRQTIFSKCRESSAKYINFTSARSSDDFSLECQKFMILATAWGVYYGYKLNKSFYENADKIVLIIYNELNVGLSGFEDDYLYLFATNSGTQKLIKARLEKKEIEEDYQEDQSDLECKAHELCDWLIGQDYTRANSNLMAMMIATANLYWSQLPEGMTTSRYARFECAVWSIFLCRFMLFSQLHKPRDFIDAFSKDITEMLVITASKEYGFNKKQVDDYVWMRFSAYDKIMMSKRENSQKTDAMLDYLVDIILYETHNQQLEVASDIVFIPNVMTRMEAHHLATAFYEAVVTTGGELLRSEYTLSTYELIY